jgi:hypothetical protein
MHIIQPPLFDLEAFISQKTNNRLVKLLEALPAEKLLAILEREHWTGRKGYSARGMWSALIAGLNNQTIENSRDLGYTLILWLTETLAIFSLKWL